MNKKNYAEDTLEGCHKYDDIIHLPRHISPTRPPMPREDRAAQFAPFAALTGHQEAVQETARWTEEKIELDENEKMRVDETLQILRERLVDLHPWKESISPGEEGELPEVTLVYFLPDGKKAGGAYVSITGRVKKIDEYRRLIVMEDGREIPVDDLKQIILE